MAAISRRPRFKVCAIFVLSLTAAACSLVRPVETPVDKPAAAQRLAADGKHAQAAAAYAELAGEDAPNHDNYELLSAEQWVAAGDIAQAKEALAAVSADARNRLPVSRALVAAEIALAENDGVRALHELDGITVPAQPDLAQNYWWIRGRGAFIANHPVEGTKAFVERERYLPDPAALRASREDLFARIRTAAERGTSLKAPPNTDPTVEGWLALGPVAVELARDPMHASAALAAWKKLHPTHPANDSVLGEAQTQLAVATEFPDQIALLLPLSGRAESVGIAVRDGFVAAYLEQAPAARPKLKIYDVAAESVAAAYAQAIADGAGFVVGPLTKEDVAAVAPLTGGKTPLLALNSLNDTVNTPRNFYQFSLLPEDEARIVARRLVADGKLKGVALFPNGEWGNRVAAAFNDELSHLGGSLLDGGRYETSQADFGTVIKQVFQIRGGKGEPIKHREDAAFVFVASSTPSAARLIVSQLKFHYVGDVPMYSMPESFEPDASANGDLDGITFPDMPWMVSSDAVTSEIRDGVRGAWPNRIARKDRLYAFGFDAYRLVPALRSKQLAEGGEISGVTGRLRLDDHNLIRRDLDWAQIRGGAPANL